MSPFWYRITRMVVFAALWTGVAEVLASDPTRPGLRGHFETASDGSRQFVLEWDAVPNARYKLETSNLDPAASATGRDIVWKGIDLSTPPTSAGRLVVPVIPPTRPDAGPPPAFYRLVLPQPEIFAVEPAITPPGVETEFYVVGQCFSEDLELRIGPKAQTNREIINPNLMRVTFTPTTPGTYEFELVRTGMVLSAFNVISADASRSPEVVLQEPSDFPPASPISRFAGSLIPIDDVDATAMGIPSYDKYTRRAKTTEAIMNLAARRLPTEIDIPLPYRAEQYRPNHDVMRAMNDWPGQFTVGPLSAELQHQVVDMYIPGRSLAFVWTRTYRSRTGRATPMGENWDHCYNVYVSEVAGDLWLYDGTGRRDVLHRQADGTYSAAGLFYEAALVHGRVKVKFPWLGEWNFHPLDGSPASGKIESSVDRNGNRMAFTYNSAGQLSEIVDDLDRTNRIAYDTSGRIASVTDFTGRAVTYTYSGGTGRDLVAVVSPPVTGTPNGNDFPGGKTNKYTYTRGFADDRLNHNLSSVTDGKDEVWLQVFYRQVLDPAAGNFDSVDFVQRGASRTHLHRVPLRPAPSNHFAIAKCIVKDGVGNVTEFFMDARHRCVQELEYTGRAQPDIRTTDTQNRPVAKLRPCGPDGQLKCDPDYFETLYSWNNDHLCTAVRYPGSNSCHFVYERDFNSNASPRKKGDLRVLREVTPPYSDPDSDGDGVLDDAELAWYFQYHPDYGSPALREVRDIEECKKRPLLALRELAKVDTDKHRPPMMRKLGEGNPWIGDISATSGFTQSGKMKSTVTGVEMFRKRCRSFTVESAGPGRFATSVTDPRGSVTTCDYDSDGNVLVIQHHGRLLDGSDSPVENFEYNQFGQLTAYVHPPDGDGRRRRDLLNHTYYLDSIVTDATSDAADPGLELATRFRYDAVGNLTQITDARGFVTDIVYNSLNQPVQVQVDSKETARGRNRIVTAQGYDANNRVIQIDYENSDENDVIDSANPTWTTQFGYDALGRMTDCWMEKDSSGALIHAAFQYDANDNMALYRSPEAVNGHDPNATVSLVYDERDLLFRVIRAPGSTDQSVVQIDYTANGRKSVQWEPHKAPGLDSPELERTTYAYDGFDRPVSVTDPMGNVARINYDRTVNVLRLQVMAERDDVPGGAGNVRYHDWQWRYDSLGRAISSHGAHFDIATQSPIGDGERTHRFTYAPNGLLLSETDDNARVTIRAFNKMHRLLRKMDAGTNTTTFDYDACGNLLSVTETDQSIGAEQVFVKNYTYDPLGRCTSERDNLGNNVNWFFGSRSVCLRSVDANGNITKYSYDGLNRPTVIIVDVDRDGALDFALDSGRAFAWDDNSRLMASMDDNSNTTVYAYDSLDRKTLATSPDGTRHTFVWDSRSQRVSMTDPNGTVTSNRYDALSRCVRMDLTLGLGVRATTTFEEFSYDGMSRVVRARNDVSLGTFAYDSHGNCLSQVQDGLETVGAFDGAGNRTSLVYPSGSVVYSVHDALNRVIEMLQSPILGARPVQLATFGYDGPGRLSRITRANGINTRLRWDGMMNPPNAVGDFGWKQVAAIRHARQGATMIVHQSSNRWDRAQNSAARDNHLQGAVDVIYALRLAYDGANRLIQSQRETNGVPEGETSYLLDGNGNRRAVTIGGMAMVYTMDNGTPEPADFQMDQYTFTPFGGQRYDLNGNLIARDGAAGSILYHYDGLNRLVLVQGSHGPAVTDIASYSYDALGRRVSKTIYPPAPMDPVMTAFIHDGGDVIEEREGGVVVRSFVLDGTRSHDDGVVRTFTWTQTSGPLVMQSGRDTYYYHCDDLGNTLALTDAIGSVVERYIFDDYGNPGFLDAEGNPLVTSDGIPVTDSPLGNRYLFQRMEWDAEIAMYNDRRWRQDPYAEDILRIYDPNTGRYTSRKGANESSAIATLRSSRPGQNTVGFSGNNPWTPSQLTGRPVGQPNAAGLGSHVQRGAYRSIRRDYYAVGSDAGRMAAYWPHMHKTATHLRQIKNLLSVDQSNIDTMVGLIR